MKVNRKILVVATTAQTFHQILEGQPRSLKEKFDVHLVSADKELLEIVARNENCKFTHVHMERGISPVRDFCSLVRLIFAILIIKPDLIHSYTPKAGLLSAIAGFICNVSVRVHTFTGLLFPTEVGFKKLILKTSDMVVCLLNTDIVAEGQGVKSDLELVTRKKLTIIGSGNIAGIDAEYFSPNCEVSYSTLSSVFTFCYVGRLNEDKGIFELVTAFEELPDSVNCNLILVGGLDNEKPVASNVMLKIKRNPKITWVGQVEDIRPYLSCANVHILPSYREGFPNVVLQASAMAVPSIVTDVNGSREIVLDGITGWIVAPKSVDDLLSAMLESYDCRSLHDMGITARVRVVEKFERSKYLKLLRDYYENRFS